MKMVSKIMKHIPNTITSANLFCGCIAIVFALNGNLETASYLIIFATILDFLDGFAARMLNAYSPIGKDLDSLADVVSFGLAPAMILYSIGQDIFQVPYFKYTVFLVTVFAAIRLAKFNNDERQSKSFFGLPVPAMALFIVSYSFFPIDSIFYQILINPIGIIITSIGLSLLMVSNIGMFSFKLSSYNFSDNITQYLFLLAAIILIALLKLSSFTIIILIYILISLGISLFCKKKIE